MYPDPGQLRDIHAVLGNPWWPLAHGWWLLAGTALGLGFIAWGLRGSWRLRVPIPFITLGDWRWDAGRALRQLRRPAPDMGLKARIAALSELLRRIAMARHGRAACAGRTGTDWLDWLAAHDPKGFDWRRHGQVLIASPYAPDPPDGAGRQDLARLFDATEAWITIRPPHPTGATRLTRWARRLPWRVSRGIPSPASPGTGQPPRP